MGGGAAVAVSCREAAVDRLANDRRDRYPSLGRQGEQSLVAFVVEQNLKPVGKHAHTVACAEICSLGPGDRVVPPIT